jgi:hypothetical protein
MARLIDRNANALAHDFATPPYRLSAVYIAYSPGSGGTLLKVGATEVQSRDIAEVLRGVQRRVRVAIPCTGPRRKPSRPTVFVWVILSAMPVLRHELEQALVECFGDRRHDPAGLRRREFCDPGSFGGIMRVVDEWRNAFPDALSESLFSEDAGVSYVAPRRLLPYAGETEGLWIEPRVGEEVWLHAPRRNIPHWTPARGSARLATGRGTLIESLMRGHHAHRADRLRRALRDSPAVWTHAGGGYRVELR